MKPSRGPTVAAAPLPSAGALRAAVALAVAGLGLALYLARVHVQAHAGITSFCTINDVVNCDRVATSPYSVFLGLPVAVWGALGYALAGVLAAWGLFRRSGGSSWPVGLLFAVALAAVGASVVLALVSEFAIGALCLLCAASWLTSIGLLAAAARACRGMGVPAALRADLAAMRQSPRLAAALVALCVGGTAFAAVAYPRYWDRPRPAGGSPSHLTASPDGGRPVVATGGTRVVVEYSDYECPFCAKAHEQSRAIREQRPDITVVRRQFPLDASCNPALTKTVHPTACALARVAICAGDQGKFDAMDDALFRNQRDRLPVRTLAEQLGLDVGKLQACLTAPETERKLEADIQAGIRANVRATPSYDVGGVVKAGEFPLELLPPAPSATAQRGQ